MEILAVRVKNPGKEERRERFDNHEYVIPPGGEALVPPEAAKLWLGDWDARNINELRRPRDDEIGRLRVRYGVYDSEPLPEAPLHVFSMSGARIDTVLDDPYGAKLQAVASGDEEKLRLQDLLARYERELGAIRSQIKAKEGALSIDEIPEDQGDDEPKPRRRRRSPKPESPPEGAVEELPEDIET